MAACMSQEFESVPGRFSSRSGFARPQSEGAEDSAQQTGHVPVAITCMDGPPHQRLARNTPVSQLLYRLLQGCRIGRADTEMLQVFLFERVTAAPFRSTQGFHPIMIFLFTQPRSNQPPSGRQSIRGLCMDERVFVRAPGQSPCPNRSDSATLLTPTYFAVQTASFGLTGSLSRRDSTPGPNRHFASFPKSHPELFKYPLFCHKFRLRRISTQILS